MAAFAAGFELGCEAVATFAAGSELGCEVVAAFAASRWGFQRRREPSADKPSAEQKLSPALGKLAKSQSRTPTPRASKAPTLSP